MHTVQGPGQPRGKGPASGHTDAGSTLVSTSPLSKSLGLTELMVFVIKLTRQVKKNITWQLEYARQEQLW